MNWRQKAAIQNLVARLPPGLGNALYYRLQCWFGGLYQPTPISRLRAGAEVAWRIHKAGRPVEGKVFLEVGTGHQLNLPLSLWLCGAAQIITVDLNPYLKESLVMQDLDFLRDHRKAAREIYAGLARGRDFEERWDRLLSCHRFPELLATTQIRYLAPADAAHLELRDGSADYHVSFTVLEHIPPDILKAIFLEGRRLLKRDGLFVHYIDFSDHFAHSDEAISSIHFLQFSEAEWAKLAGNRFMFHNRLRRDEFQALIRGLGLEILTLDSRIDPDAVAALQNGFVLNDRFQSKDLLTNATLDAWLLAKPFGGENPPPIFLAP